MFLKKSKSIEVLRGMKKEDQMRFHFIFHFSELLESVVRQEILPEVYRFVKGGISENRTMELLFPFVFWPMKIESGELNAYLHVIPNRTMQTNHWKMLMDLMVFNKKSNSHDPYDTKREFLLTDISNDPTIAYQQMLATIADEAKIDATEEMLDTSSSLFKRYKSLVEHIFIQYNARFEGHKDGLARKTIQELENACPGLEFQVIYFNLTMLMRDNPGKYLG